MYNTTDPGHSTSCKSAHALSEDSRQQILLCLPVDAKDPWLPTDYAGRTCNLLGNVVTRLILSFAMTKCDLLGYADRKELHVTVQYDKNLSSRKHTYIIWPP